MATPHVSVVIVAFDMQRELPRTLRSLSRPYQRMPGSLQLEVIVVDNGSPLTPDAKTFDGLGLNLTMVRCATPSPSPVFAMNEGLGRARGDVIGAWIDGARLASPGLIWSCVAASRLAPRAVVATRNWQLGPQRQHLAMAAGYDQQAEDRLLDTIRWPDEPYRLFEVSTPEGKGGDSGPMLESNALFLSRGMWEELGGYDPVFDEAGGGAANPDLLRRALELPGAQLIRIGGEGTFHQFHGGVTTSTVARASDAMKLASAKYYRVRGRPLVPVRETGRLFYASADDAGDEPAERVL